MWKSSTIAFVICAASTLSTVEAWLPLQPTTKAALRSSPSITNAASSSSSSRLFSAREKMLREEIASRNQAGEGADDTKYAIVDGELLEKLDTPQGVDVSTMPGVTAAATATTPVAAVDDKKSLKARMERVMRPRAYPLFLAEKAVDFVESSIEGIAKSFNLDASADDATNGSTAVKERIVVLGTGWGGAAFLQTIDTDLYDVTVISPRNHFVFTPMLAGASVGTVEFRSICQPIREINRKASYLEGTATSIDPKTRTVTCESVKCEGNSCDIDEFQVQYDRLVVTVGAQVNTFGIKGVREHCNFLKQVEDARRIRTSIVNCFERANLPNQSEEQRKRELTFVIIGAGPTGIEFAAELRDFVEQDGPKYYPDLLKFVRIKVIEATSTVLAPFDKSLQEEAVKQLQRETYDPQVSQLLPPRYKMTEIILENGVKEVTEQVIYLNDGTELPYGLAVWAGGNGPLPITLDLIKSLGEEQAKEQDVSRGRIAVDPWMRAVGGEGRILAFGDCACMYKCALPATGQVASQQGEFLAKMMNHKYELSPPVSEDGLFPPPMKVPEKTVSSIADSIAGFALNNYEFAKPFQFLNLGILAYTGGGSALAQISPAPNTDPIKGRGKIGNAVWKSVYLTKQVSWRNRLLVLNDWTTRQIFGRDITRL